MWNRVHRHDDHMRHFAHRHYRALEAEIVAVGVWQEAGDTGHVLSISCKNIQRRDATAALGLRHHADALLAIYLSIRPVRPVSTTFIFIPYLEATMAAAPETAIVSSSMK